MSRRLMGLILACTAIASAPAVGAAQTPFPGSTEATPNPPTRPDHRQTREEWRRRQMERVEQYRLQRPGGERSEMRAPGRPGAPGQQFRMQRPGFRGERGDFRAQGQRLELERRRFEMRRQGMQMQRQGARMEMRGRWIRHHGHPWAGRQWSQRGRQMQRRGYWMHHRGQMRHQEAPRFQHRHPGSN